MAAVKSLPVLHHSVGYILFPLGVGGGGGCVCSLANNSVAYEETQSNRVSDFRDFVCSSFPKTILFYFYFTPDGHIIWWASAHTSIVFTSFQGRIQKRFTGFSRTPPLT